MRIPSFFLSRVVMPSVLWVLVSALNPLPLLADSSSSENEAAFIGVWRLLSTQEKQQFLAGYIQGWKDASRVTDIAITYVRENPQEAVSGLQKIKELYDLSDLSPSVLSREIDEFYKNPQNRSATFSSAVTAARAAQR